MLRTPLTATPEPGDKPGVVPQPHHDAAESYTKFAPQSLSDTAPPPLPSLSPQVADPPAMPAPLSAVQHVPWSAADAVPTSHDVPWQCVLSAAMLYEYPVPHDMDTELHVARAEQQVFWSASITPPTTHDAP